MKTKHIIISLLASLLVISSFSSHAENQKLAQRTADATIDADPVLEFGLFLDETISKPGTDFFEIFYLYWQPKTEKALNIRIQEQPGLFRANFILLWLDEELIFRQQLPQRYDDIETLVIRSINQLNRKLLDNFFIQKQLEY